jgi:cell fate regulator YaaT (PSP1 superfamily)
MNQESPTLIVGVRFSKIGKNYYFNASHLNDIQKGECIVVETSRGWQLGEVDEILHEINPSMNQNLKKVNRRATPADLSKKQELNLKEEEALAKCLIKQRKMNIRGLKIVTAEYGFDESSISILFSSPEDEEVKGLENLQKSLREDFPKMRIDFHKIGPRDVAKYYGGLGACGLETRCCTKFLNDFQSISIKMAKIQDISLTPSDITGMCDRLRCCLNYEFSQYEEILKGLPKRNQWVMTPNGEGKVVDLLPLQEKVVVQFEEEGEKVYEAKDIQKIEPGNNPNRDKPKIQPNIPNNKNRK